MFLYLWFSVSLWTGWVWGDAVQLNSANIDTIIKENDIVMINFYADWCRWVHYYLLGNKICKNLNSPP